MSLPTPQNSEEAAYIAVATLNELIDLLIAKGLINSDDVSIMLDRVIERLSKENYFASKKAAAFLTERNVIKDRVKESLPGICALNSDRS